MLFSQRAFGHPVTEFQDLLCYGSGDAEVSGRSDNYWLDVCQRTERFAQASSILLRERYAARFPLGRSARRKWVVLSEIETKESKMSIGMILLIVLVLALVGVIPTWGHSNKWGYGPSGGIGLVLLIVLILVLMGKI